MRVATDAGEVVDDLWCVGIFLAIGNTQPDAKTLRNVSAEVLHVWGALPLPFDDGATRVDIRRGEERLLQIGYTLASKPVVMPAAALVIMDAARIELAKKKMSEDIASLFVGSPSTLPPHGIEFPPDGPPVGELMHVKLHGDDVQSVDFHAVINVLWPGIENPRFMVQPYSDAK